MTNPEPDTSSPPQPAKPLRRRSFLDAGPYVLLGMTFAGSCGAWHAALDLCAHFRVYYLIVGLIWALAIWKRIRSRAMCCLTVSVLWNAGLILPYYIPVGPSTVPESATSISLISLNVYTSNTDKDAVLAYLRERQPDLIVVMEVDDRWERALSQLKDLYPHHLIQSRADNFGIGLLSRWPLINARFVKLAETDLPNVVAQVEKEGRQFQIVGTHPLPPIGSEYTRERNAQLNEVAGLVQKAQLPCIVAGDFNATPWSSAFREFSKRSGLRDSALGRGIQGSWNAKSPLIRIPIDHVFVPMNAVVTKRILGPNVGSDHYPVEVTVFLP